MLPFRPFWPKRTLEQANFSQKQSGAWQLTSPHGLGSDVAGGLYFRWECTQCPLLGAHTEAEGKRGGGGEHVSVLAGAGDTHYGEPLAERTAERLCAGRVVLGSMAGQLEGFNGGAAARVRAAHIVLRPQEGLSSGRIEFWTETEM